MVVLYATGEEELTPAEEKVAAVNIVKVPDGIETNIQAKEVFCCSLLLSMACRQYSTV